MLLLIEFNLPHTYARPPNVHSSPYFEYVFISHSGQSHATRCMYRVDVRNYKLLQHIDEFVSVLISKVSVKFVS